MIEVGAKVRYKKDTEGEVIDVITGQDPTLYYIRTTKGECILAGSQQIELSPNQERAASI
jgi:hypothetical protein